MQALDNDGAVPARPNWYAVYTCPRHEKSVARQLEERRIEHFLPTYRSLRRWKDRRMVVTEPLFAGYVFVRIPLSDRLQVLKIGSVVRLVGFNGAPAPLPDDEVEGLRRGVLSNANLEPHPFLTAGQRVRVVNGPLAGSAGILLRRKNELRVIVSLDLIMRSVAVEVLESDVTPIR